MTRHLAPRPPLPLTVLVLAVAITPVARGQFTPDPNPITGMDTTARTLASGMGTVSATGNLQISGATVAITVTGSSSIVNNGTIQQTGTGRAIRSTTNNISLTVTNNAGALIQAADADPFQITQANTSATMNNYGSVISLNASAGGSQAIDWNAIITATNRVNNYSTGLLKATEADAVRPGVNGVVYNAGTILSVTTTGSSSDGIDAQNNTGVQVTNDTTGLIEGGRDGITGGAPNNTVIFTTSVTNNAGGVIKGDNGSGINLDGFNAKQSATVINSGTISGNGVTGDGDGVDVDGLVTVTNSGTIRSINAFSPAGSGLAFSEGMSVGGGTITNSGTIEGLVASGNTNAVGRGISIVGNDITTGPLAGTREAIYGTTVINNQAGGLIRGDSDSGIFVGGPASGFTVTINNDAGATIRGGGATSAAIQTGADNDTITNAGTIRADSSNLAINLGGGNNTLNITGGAASIVGNVNGGTGGMNALNITPGSGNTFSYAGAFSNFATVKVNAGTTTLSGDSTYTGTTTVANGGTLVAANVAANNGSATGTGAVTVQSGGTLAGTGRIAGTVTLASGALLSPSNRGALTPGRLTLGCDLNVTGNSRFAFSLGGTAGSDSLAVGGALIFTTGSGPLVFDVLDGGGLTTGRYELINSGSVTGLTLADLSFGTTPAGFSGTFDLTNGTSLGLTVNAVPEPTTGSALLVGSLALGGGAWLKRKRRLTPAGGHRASGSL